MPLIKTFRYRPEIDGLRAVAVLAVVLFHTGFGCPGGFVGVDVFFVISGYLITSLIWKRIETESFTFADFWERRARRIIPALIAVTFATMVAGYFILLPPHFEELGKATASQSVFAANFHYWQHTGYFAGASEEKPLLHTWSLAVEEQFYFIAPFLLWGVARVTILRSRRSLLSTLGVGFILSFAASIYGVTRYPSATFYLLPTRAWELLLGSIVAFLPTQRFLRHSRVLAEVVSLTGILCIVIPVFVYGAETPFPGIAALLPCSGAALFIWSNTTMNEGKPTHVGTCFSIRPLVFIGLVSYSWYLWHWPILAFYNYTQLGETSFATRLGLFVAGLACAVASWRYIETPFRKHNLWKSRRMVFGFSAVSLSCIFACGIFSVYNDGFPKRVSTQVLAAISAESDMGVIYRHNAEEIRSGNAAKIGVAEMGLSPVLLVWGDSHAMAALPAIDEVLKGKGLAGRAAAHSATAPVIGWFRHENRGLNERSFDFNDAVLSYIDEQNIPTVLLHAMWKLYVDAPDVSGVSFEEALVNTVKQLRSLGVNVYVMLDVPCHKVHVPKVISRKGKSYMAPKLVKPSEIEQADGLKPLTIARLESLGATVINPKPVFLDPERDRYRVQVDGVILYRDKSHLTTSGAVKMLKPLLEKALKSALVPAPSKSEDEQIRANHAPVLPVLKPGDEESPEPMQCGQIKSD